MRRKIEQDTRLIESGEESYGSLAERYGVSKSTIYRIHIKKLRRLVEKAKQELGTLRREKEKLQADFEGLHQKYQRKNEELQKKHEERKRELEAEIHDRLIEPKKRR